jgi:hypothetical protein
VKASTSSSGNATTGSSSSAGPSKTGNSSNFTNTVNCQYPILRIKNGSSLNYSAIIAAGKSYTDSNFNSTSADTLYFKGYSQGILSSVASKFTWARVKSNLKNATIFGNSSSMVNGLNNVSIFDVRQGYYGDDSYFLSALTSASLSSSVDFMQTILT